jgi:predicted DCC family thiol-disulfide oxidoreductase YuxK
MIAEPITVIYDGQCRLCRASINWLQAKSEITALSFHDIDPEIYHLTRQKCETQVIAINQKQILKGATAVAFLMNHRGNKKTSRFITATGPLAHIGYKWVSTHRNSPPVKALTYILEKATRTR